MVLWMSDRLYIGKYVFDTLVAVSEEEQTIGLMFRKWPPPVMTFPYKTAGVRKFWMKNTISPLDILFCREGYIIDICKGEPMSTCMIGPNKPVDLVIELPYGTATDKNIKIGQKVHLRRSLETIKKHFPSMFI